MCISIHAVCTMNFRPKEGVLWSPQVIFERNLWDSLGISGARHAVPGPLGTCIFLLLDSRTWGQPRQTLVLTMASFSKGCYSDWLPGGRSKALKKGEELCQTFTCQSSATASTAPVLFWVSWGFPQLLSSLSDLFLTFFSLQIFFFFNPTWREYWGKGNILKINIWPLRLPIVLKFF